MLNINTKILELVVVSPLSYLDYSVLVHRQNIEKTVSLKHAFACSLEMRCQFSFTLIEFVKKF